MTVAAFQLCTCELGIFLLSQNDAAPPLPGPPQLLQLLRPAAVFRLESLALHPQRLCGHTHTLWADRLENKQAAASGVVLQNSKFSFSVPSVPLQLRQRSFCCVTS